MKVAVYTIALNEEKFADRWAEATAGADYRIVADTGSTDGTAERLRAAGVTVYPISVRPWRFDRAREASLALVPADADLCICLDLDEVLRPEWREILRRVWESGTKPRINRVRYTYIWSWRTAADGKQVPEFVYRGDKIHGRHTHRWRCPAHECAAVVDGVEEVAAIADDLVIEHHPDPLKSRGSYVGLLALGAREDPGDGRMAHYHGRELMFQGLHRDAITELHRHLSLPRTWIAERAQSMLYIARCHAALKEHTVAERWFVSAALETPGWREPWIELSQMHYERRDWVAGWWAAERALAITEHTSPVGRHASSWGSRPWDLAGLCAWYAGGGGGARERAVACAKKALELEPGDERLRKNVELMAAGEGGGRSEFGEGC